MFAGQKPVAYGPPEGVISDPVDSTTYEEWKETLFEPPLFSGLSRPSGACSRERNVVSVDPIPIGRIIGFHDNHANQIQKSVVR
jgi:hypothetical protein